MLYVGMELGVALYGVVLVLGVYEVVVFVGVLPEEDLAVDVVLVVVHV